MKDNEKQAWLSELKFLAVLAIIAAAVLLFGCAREPANDTTIVQVDCVETSEIWFAEPNKDAGAPTIRERGPFTMYKDAREFFAANEAVRIKGDCWVSQRLRSEFWDIENDRPLSAIP